MWLEKNAVVDSEDVRQMYFKNYYFLQMPYICIIYEVKEVNPLHFVQVCQFVCCSLFIFLTFFLLGEVVQWVLGTNVVF